MSNLAGVVYVGNGYEKPGGSRLSRKFILGTARAASYIYDTHQVTHSQFLHIRHLPGYS
jgi:hypothetical protein